MSALAQSSADRIRKHLIGLKMPRALETLQTTLAQIEQGEVSALEAIEALLGEELTTRESRRIKMALMTARLSNIKTIAGYDFSFQPSLDRNRILALAQLEFIERRQCVHLLGPPGTGKSQVSIAGGVGAEGKVDEDNCERRPRRSDRGSTSHLRGQLTSKMRGVPRGKSMRTLRPPSLSFCVDFVWTDGSTLACGHRSGRHKNVGERAMFVPTM